MPSEPVHYIVEADSLTSVAAAIRETGGTSAPLSFPTGFEAAIRSIKGNIVTGTFTAGAGGAAIDVPLAYTGNGYPIAVLLYVTDGANNSENTDVYNLIRRYAVVQWAMSKSNPTSTPTYRTSGAENYGATMSVYKNSTSSATTYTSTYNLSTNSYSSAGATNAASVAVKFKSPTVMSVYSCVLNSSSGSGFIPGAEYSYVVLYSE